MCYSIKKRGDGMKYEPYIRVVPKADTAVLMIHGIVGTPEHFKDLMPLIPESWSIYNILLDGHGGEVEDFAHTSMAKWRCQVHRQLNRILATHRRVLIIAHSMGTLFAIREAIHRPEKIAGLFLLNVPLTPYVQPKTAAASFRIVTGKPRNNGATRAILSATGVHLSPKLWKYIGWPPRFLELLRECYRTIDRLPYLKTPTLCFQSRHDELVSMRGCKYLYAQPYITTTILESSGHFAYSKIDTVLLQRKLKEIIKKLASQK